jgi:alpha-2-macroglobulin
MRKLILLILLFIPFICTAQENLKKIRTKSWQTQAYKVSVADAETYIKWDSIPVSRYVDIAPYMTFSEDYIDKTSLGIGIFILINVVDNKIFAELVNNSNLILLAINNKDRLQLDVRNKKGDFIEDAKVFVNGKEALFNKDSKTYWVKQGKLDMASVKIYAPTDTLYKTLSLKDELRISISNQKKRNYKFSKIYKILNWVPSHIKNLLTKKRTTNNIGANGYIIFNQPKYKPLDTLKFKAYVIDKKWKQYNKKVDIFINYYSKNKNIEQFVKSLKPSSAGAYVDNFLLADTLPLDTRYTFILKTKSGKRIIANEFKIEEYVLDEIGSYSFKADKDIYYRNDSIRFFASAKDANGLNLLDGKAILLLTTKSIKAIYRDTVFVIDTIYYKEVKLNTTEDTKFVIAANTLPHAFLDIDATLTFKNANNELHEEHKEIAYKYLSKEIIVTQIEDTIKAVFLEDGIEKIANGELEMDDENAINISFPYVVRIDPIINEYSFSIEGTNSKYFEVKNNYIIGLSSISNGDTLGFILNNPWAIPVYYTVFDGQKIIAISKSDLPQIKWEKVMSNNKQMYKVRWQYIWAGEERSDDESIGLYFKKLDINVVAKDIVFPGQKDSIKIKVTDYKGKPANNVNLTAVGYNNQFKKDIKVKEPPYLVKYKSKGFLEREEFDGDDMSILSKRYLLGKNERWINKLSIDTMTYYKLLLPKNGMYDAVTLINNFVPQVSINIVDKAEPQEIYLLYLNRNLVYYNGVTDKMKYAYEVYPGIVQIGIRTKDKYIEIDSVYIQPNYKHDISFDINNMPKHSTITATKKYWTNSEINLLENSMWQMQNDYKNNNAYVWQTGKLVQLSGNREHIAGPFSKDRIMFFSPKNFDIDFQFESGYQYNLSKGILRLEKKPLFVKKDTNNLLINFPTASLKLGDTMVEPPIISYPLPVKYRFLKETGSNYLHNFYASKVAGRGRIQYTSHKDSVIHYVVLFNIDSNKIALVMNNYYGKINNIIAGKYLLLLITNNFTTAAVKNLLVMPNGTTCVNADSARFENNNDLINKLLAEAEESLIIKEDKKVEKIIPQKEIKQELKFIENGVSSITGVILDDKTNLPIPFCSVLLKGYNFGTTSDDKGNFNLRGLTNMEYIVEFSAVGYQNRLEKIELKKGQEFKIKVKLAFSISNLSEVVVTTAHGVVRQKSSFGYSASKISSNDILAEKSLNITTILQGRAAGINIQTNGGNSFDSIRFTLRGARSLTGNNEPLLVVDGIVTRLGKLSDINPNDVAEVATLSSSAASAIYGSAGINGVIIVTTKRKTERKTFRDYAIWQPNFFTDKNGNASFEVEYPDNITSWKTFIVAMDKKRRIGKMSFLTQAYKPIVSQLNLPQFLLAGDTSYFVGKSMNYTSDKYTVKTEFILNGISKSILQKEVACNDANIEKLMVNPHLEDTITARYSLQTTTGFKDAEERKIPVFKKGTEEAVGNFWILQNDTTVSFKSLEGKTEINIYAQNNTLDVLLAEIEHLKNYPYACMEQTASKLTGLVMEKKVKEQLKLPFKNQKMFDVLLQKVQKAQLFDGGWPWWESGKANLHITNYVLNALLLHRDNALVETNIRNGFLYLQNQLPILNRSQLLASLLTLSNGKHEIDYGKWLNKINFDSITQYEQWQWVSIKQLQKMSYEKELRKLIDNKTTTTLGGIHWGEENYSWYSNDIAATVNAFNVIKNEVSYKNMVPNIIQYFLEKRKRGYWANTVESASILNAIMPEILATQKEFTSPATLTISGDTSFSITNFPYKYSTKNAAIRDINITKSGGGLVYFTAYQKVFNTNPTAVKTNFIINTSFQREGQAITSIKSGERIKMIIGVDALKDAEYVMLQMPIPAGCLYANKTNYSNGVYREFFKDKVAMFIESLPKGKHFFEIELEPRYNGTYMLNPTKVELMYYPTFFGRNDMKWVQILGK